MIRLKRMDQALALLRRKQARGGMTYRGAVNLEALISALERIRLAMADTLKNGRPDTQTPPETALDMMLRGLDI